MRELGAAAAIFCGQPRREEAAGRSPRRAADPRRLLTRSPRALGDRSTIPRSVPRRRSTHISVPKLPRSTQALRRSTTVPRWTGDRSTMRSPPFQGAVQSLYSACTTRQVSDKRHGWSNTHFHSYAGTGIMADSGQETSAGGVMMSGRCIRTLPTLGETVAPRRGRRNQRDCRKAR